MHLAAPKRFRRIRRVTLLHNPSAWKLSGFDEDGFVFTDATPSMFPYLSICISTPITETTDNTAMGLVSVRRLTDETCKKVPGASAGMIEVQRAYCDRSLAAEYSMLWRCTEEASASGDFLTGTVSYRYEPFLRNKREVNLFREPGLGDKDPELIQFALGALLNRRYQWTVELQVDDAPSVDIYTTPEGAKELFKWRDVPPGKSRRDALRNWVREHARRKSSGDFTMVRQHLRGVTSFTWAGLKARLRPSQFDIEKSHDLAIGA